jgi:Ala-tRNA(Pro) deacylase
MHVSTTLQMYLAQKGIAYDVVPHPYAISTMNAATSAEIPPDKIAKPVILEDENGYLMAVIPGDHKVNLGKLSKLLGRRLGLATEPELGLLFEDCEAGAIPPVGAAFGIDTICDDGLDECEDVYLEAGDHEDFLHMRGASFRKLMKGAQHANIS